MAHIPKSVIERQPSLKDLELRGRGKVRDSYLLPRIMESVNADLMLVVASDRCSIFDFVLPTLIRKKGEILTALNRFWIGEVVEPLCGLNMGHDLMVCGAESDNFLPDSLRNNPDLQKRASVVRVLPAPDVEDIVRINLTGSGWKSYKESHQVCGHTLPSGLLDGNKLPYPIYTPTTKAQEGHDEHISANSVAEKYGVMRERLSLQVAGAISAYAERRGIILADTKFEFSRVGDQFFLADEKGTPDSSRFWDAAAWKVAQAKGKLPPSFDKQYVRDWGKTVGLDKLDPTNPEHLAFVDDLNVPEEVRTKTTLLYRYIFWRLTGRLIEDYQRNAMGIDTAIPRRKIEVVIGSKSDLPQLEAGLDWLHGKADVQVSVISCHRNVGVLQHVIHSHLGEADIVIAAAGMAAALPGMLKTFLCVGGYANIPVIGVAMQGKRGRDDKAAILSIECLPETPVELDENGQAYFGPQGFLRACEAAVGHEFLPKKIAKKPHELGFLKFS